MIAPIEPKAQSKSHTAKANEKKYARPTRHRHGGHVYTRNHVSRASHVTRVLLGYVSSE
jgi:hypothetical protein